MTPHTPSDSPERRDRPEAEIEVTPAMLEAAHSVLTAHYLGDLGHDLSDSVLTALFRAMLESSRP